MRKKCLTGVLTAVVMMSAAAVDDFPPVTTAEQYCMAEAMYFEARSEGWRGMLAVGVVIKNRMASTRYPDTACAVVHQGAERNDRLCQFSYFCDGLPEVPADAELWSLAQRLSDAVLRTDKISMREVGDATHYHSTKVCPWWSEALTRTGSIGAHIFYL